MSQLDKLLPRLQKVRKTGTGKWMSCCPGHADKSPSLGIKLTDDDKILIHCFSGCSVSEIVDSVGLTLSDLMPEKPNGYDRKKTNAPKFNKFELFDLLVFESLILSFAIRRLFNKEALGAEDISRIHKAEEIIQELAREWRQ